MDKDHASILTINGGSSSIKFALFKAGKNLKRSLQGKIDRIGLKDPKLTFQDGNDNKKDTLKLKASDHQSAAIFLIDWLEKQIDFTLISGVGHRVVFGMKHTEPELITHDLLNDLHRISPYDTDHLPAEIELMKAFSQRHPKMLQVACFDTAFHSEM